jgi:hypothetical protein
MGPRITLMFLRLRYLNDIATGKLSATKVPGFDDANQLPGLIANRLFTSHSSAGGRDGGAC